MKTTLMNLMIFHFIFSLTSGNWKPSKSFLKKFISHFVNKVSCQVTLSFSPYPLFQWYPQSKKISINLSVK